MDGFFRSGIDLRMSDETQVSPPPLGGSRPPHRSDSGFLSTIGASYDDNSLLGGICVFVNRSELQRAARLKRWTAQ